MTRYPELALDRWAKKYGPLFSMWLGDQLYVVLSDPHIVKDLVITNGAIFSSRKDMYMKSQIILKGRGITATPYDDTWYATHHVSQGCSSFIALQAQASPSCQGVLDGQGRFELSSWT